ncbi:MAG: bifunctional 1-(5-phosphoribosyl)-5-((5-phosphoribosylamino)methylideneamino)imidazole-4-carboxamide isomerase/phosphoribosylanthranilate isomerase PriA [Actinomycetales bacterium]|nr:bifunctional 1-(5-phosphoribosyl)-5-((5-phosphoribosylamino)methylideneamino)imidazole-4-carboxamide isomerase/phosphoribosylanthranilate isomerase PriA [Actinomycetales bacterium]
MSEPQFTVYPALDVAAGALATPGGAARASVLGHSPAQVLAALADAGAAWVHLVDLDRARGAGANDDAIAASIALAHSLGMRVQLSGGILDAAGLARAVGSGADRVNLACESLQDRRWLEGVLRTPPIEVNLCLDVRGELLISRGTGIVCGPLADALEWLAPMHPRLVVTDIDADGALAGPPLGLLGRVADHGFAVIASGGVRDTADLGALRGLAARGVNGVIVGAALHAGALALTDC